MKSSEAPDWVRRLDALYDRMMERSDRLQDYWRDFAFLGLDEEIRVAGDPSKREERTVKVRLLTLQMFIELCAVRSPFLTGGSVRPEHVLQILWRLSPEYDRRDDKPTAESGSGIVTPRQRFVAKVAHLPFHPSVRAISRYLDRMLIDKPASNQSKETGSDTSFATSIVHVFASTYGWSDATILRLPMPALFQYLRRIQREHDPDATAFNPLRDKFTQQIFQTYLTRKAANVRRDRQES